MRVTFVMFVVNRVLSCGFESVDVEYYVTLLQLQFFFEELAAPGV
jgi:hypothetical protein